MTRRPDLGVALRLVLGAAVVFASPLLFGAGCGDTPYPGPESAPPLNAGPGTTSLYSPPSSGGGGGGGGGGLGGDWFKCEDEAAEGGDPCGRLDGQGFGFHVGGRFVLLVGTRQPGGPYCEVAAPGARYTVSGNSVVVTVPVPGQQAMTRTLSFAITGDRAVLTEGQDSAIFLRQTNSTGPCLPNPG